MQVSQFFCCALRKVIFEIYSLSHNGRGVCRSIKKDAEPFAIFKAFDSASFAYYIIINVGIILLFFLHRGICRTF